MNKSSSSQQQPMQPKGNVPPINATVGMSQAIGNNNNQIGEQPRPSVQPHQSSAHEQIKQLKEQNK